MKLGVILVWIMEWCALCKMILQSTMCSLAVQVTYIFCVVLVLVCLSVVLLLFILTVSLIQLSYVILSLEFGLCWFDCCGLLLCLPLSVLLVVALCMSHCVTLCTHLHGFHNVMYVILGYINV